MFGYVRPLKAELKVREFELFKSCYCSICHVLQKNYGFFSRFILNYDFTFLAMLFWPEDAPFSFERKRCIVSPFRKKCVCGYVDSLDVCAGYSVILAYSKLKDVVVDGGFFDSAFARLYMILLKRAYKKASKKYKAFDDSVTKSVRELSLLEKAEEKSIDKMADKFAYILSTASGDNISGAKKRELELLLYHLGRWIYIIDAVDDIKEDFAAKRYNPVAARFDIEGDTLSDENARILKTTLGHSLNMLSSAFELLPNNIWSDIIRNIIYLGLPDVSERVFSGKFKNSRDGIPR